MKGFESVLAALDAWEAQTRREALEILILCPDHLGPTDRPNPRGLLVQSTISLHLLLPWQHLFQPIHRT